jgi:hypothetical protein
MACIYLQLMILRADSVVVSTPGFDKKILVTRVQISVGRIFLLSKFMNLFYANDAVFFGPDYEDFDTYISDILSRADEL